MRLELRRYVSTTLSVALAVAFILPSPQAAAQREPESAGFAQDLETLRSILGIPGMSVAVVRDEMTVFAEGFGWADVEHKTPARPDTPYGLASVTKPVAATLVMQLVEEGLVDLDEPVSSYGVTVHGAPDVTARHLLTHTSEGVPGTSHVYSGNRYALLGGVIEGATGRSFATELGERILSPLEMTDSALGPLESTAGQLQSGFETLRHSVGWGVPFEQYPDVYHRLASPYQFDTDYQVIPGMYHLDHSPAAGLSSSVEDLAAFDIALDRGLVLGDEARTEMLAPAYPTGCDHEGCEYGLGWYVQEFSGMTIQWHSGRWPPSTSALYMRFPEYRLSFIVLANTDNLTVPFYGLGVGDVMTSALALTFYRHYLFPEIHGHELPEIDWTGSAQQITTQLEDVEQIADRDHLERELWSFRQAFASAGQRARVEALARVALIAFGDSELHLDPLFSALPGEPTVVAPVLSAQTMVIVSWAVVSWLILVVFALIWMAGALYVERARPFFWGIWLCATAFLGPIAPALHRVTRPTSSSSSPWQRSLDASIVSITGYSLAWTAAWATVLSLATDANALILLGMYLLVATVGLLAVRGPLLLHGGIDSYVTAVRKATVSELTAVNLGVGVLLSLTLWVDNSALSQIPFPTSPYYWGTMAVLTTTGMLVLWPLEYWSFRRGFSVWPPGENGEVIRLPSWRDSWWMVLTTFAVMILTIGATGLLTG